MVTRTSIEQIQAIGDFFVSWDWEVVVPRIPGIADSRQFTVRATASTIPGWNIEQLTHEGHGTKVRQPGKLSFDDTWEVTLVEGRDMLTRTMMNAWREATRSWQANGGGYKSEIAVNVSLTLLDAKGVGLREIILQNCFPTALGQATLDQGSGIVTYQCTFSFDQVIETAAVQ